MSRAGAAVLVATALALATATAWVPTVEQYGLTQQGAETQWPLTRWPPAPSWEPLWTTWAPARPHPHVVPGDALWMARVIVWNVLLLEVGSIVVLSGGLLAWLLRRDRRRRAGTAA